MKKKISSLLILCMAISLLCACGKGGNDTDVTTKQEENAPEAEATETPREAEEVAEEEVDDTVYLLTSSITSDTMFFVKSDGSVIKTIKRSDIEAKIPESDRKTYDVNDETEYQRSELVAEGDGFLFFRDGYYDNSKSVYKIFAIREEDFKIYDIEEYDRDLFVKAFDYYNGCFFIDVNLGYDENYKSTGEKEYCFVYDDASDSFVSKDAPIDKVTESAIALGLDNLHGTSDRSDYGRLSLTRTLDECGFILANSEKGQVMLDANGAATPLINAPEEYFFAYDDKYMYYTTWDSNKTSLFCYDVKNQTSGPVKDDINTVTFLAFEGGKLYFSDQRQEEYGVKNNYVYAFDEESGKADLLYVDKSTPGVKIEPGVEGFKIKNGNIFVISYDEGATKWAKVECDGEKPNYKLLDCPVSTIEVFEYGKVTYDSATFKCPDCGTPLVMVYAECFELDSKYSKCADKINSVLKDRQQAFIGTDERVQSSSDEDDELYYVSCDEHKEHPEWYQTTEDTYVVKVEIINDRYLAVNMDGYWYGGGAHGMPLRDQDLFDLETGDEITLADLYTGTEEDFKLLIAEKTKEDYLSYDEYELPYYSGDNVDAVYNQAYESAALNGGNVEFTQDGIYYYYPPYEMGPYAAGYIDIFISYRELLGRDDL